MNIRAIRNAVIRHESGGGYSTWHGHYRFYRWLKPLPSGELAIYTVACKELRPRRRPELMVKVVNRIYTSRDIYYSRDLARSFWGFLAVDFSQEGGQRHYWSRAKDDDDWGVWKIDSDRTWLIDAVTLNPEAIKRTRYAKCGYFDHPCCLDLIRYIRFLREYPQVEFLQKAGLSRFIERSFVRKLLADRSFFTFFRSHIAELRADSSITRPVFRIAARRGCSFADAKLYHDIPSLKRIFKSIPQDLFTLQNLRRMTKEGIDLREYDRYCTYISECGEDIHSYGVTFPRDFRNAIEEAEARAHRMKAKKAEKDRRRISEAISSVFRRLARFNGNTFKGLVCAIPKSSSDLVHEGNSMENCIGRMGYGDKIANGQSIILFIRDCNGKPFVDVEIDCGNWQVVQCYGKANSDCGSLARRFAERLCRSIRRDYGKSRAA